MAYASQKEYDKCIADFDEAVRRDPENRFAYQNRGNAYSEKEDYEKALADYSQALRIDPKYAPAHVGRGQVYANTNRYDQAIEEFNEAVRLAPKYALAHGSRGHVFALKEDFDNAIADYSAAIRLDPKFVFAYENRGYIYRKKKDYAKAIQGYAEASRLDAKPATLLTVAWLLATCPENGVRDRKKAVEYATRAWKLSRQKEAAPLDKLAAQAEGGDLAATLKRQKALELSRWDEAIYLDTLAAAHAEAGDFKEAVKWQKKAMELGFGDKKVEDRARQRLKLYEAGKPYRDEG